MKRGFWWGLLAVLMVGFLGWRLVRPLNIFVVGDRFAWPIVTSIPKGLQTLRAAECGTCHQEIYQEWSGSLHAQAWTEEYFVADRAFEKEPPVCDNCHIQLARQRPTLTVGFRDDDRLFPVTRPNPDFDPGLQQEGVTCAVCHVRDGVVIGPFETDLAPHPVKADPDFLSRRRPCEICHDVPGNRWDMFYDKPPCGTLEEIAAGGMPPDCVSCHLPRVERSLVPGGPSRLGGRHLFQGGHTPAMVKQGVTVAHRLMKEGDGWQLTVRLTNTGAHHFIPTGTPDRHLTLTMRLLDEKNQPVREVREVMKRTILWRPFIIDLWDTRLAYHEPRTYDMTLSPGEGRQVEITVTYHLLEESRRARIGYRNTQPISYPIYQETIDLGQQAENGG